MIVYIPNGNGQTRRDYIAAGCGIMAQRYDFWFPKIPCRWVLDNGAYDDFLKCRPFNAPEFSDVIDRVLQKPQAERPEWVVCPDSVADPDSLVFSALWRSQLPNELRWYLAIQDGMDEVRVDKVLRLQQFDGLFIGGSTTWKNENAAAWVRFGKARKLPVHLARANGARRLQWAVTIGADSLDGTGWTRNPGWIRHILEMPTPDLHAESIFGGDR